MYATARYFYLVDESRQKKYHKKFTNRSVYGFGRIGCRLHTNKRYESVITPKAPLLPVRHS